MKWAHASSDEESKDVKGPKTAPQPSQLLHWRDSRSLVVEAAWVVHRCGLCFLVKELIVTRYQNGSVAMSGAKRHVVEVE